ncbi:MAG: triose-phosphate isomerase [Defluviitaleaceae bacterium]|nr:triose-phosphate isomerase [Defluviitaleaceae bacterium]
MPKKIIAGNWKMNATSDEVIAALKPLDSSIDPNKAEVILCVPYVALESVKAKLAGTKIKVSAQNMHYEEKGAYTGEVSGEMLKGIGINHTLIGHSERRQYYGETDETVNQKVLKALKLDITPILCVGESLEQRKKEITNEVLRQQVNHALFNVCEQNMTRIVIAYEPIWAIGTGVVATPCQAEDACKYIREVVTAKYGADVSSKVTILYGGSVDDKNAKELFAQPNIDGGLVGGASLKPTFADVAKAGLPK